jgi:hypothetical protein
VIEVALGRRLDDASGSFDRAQRLGDLALQCFGAPIRSVRVRVHRNRSTLVSWKHERGRLHLGVHEALLHHPDDVLAVAKHRDEAALARLRAVPRMEEVPKSLEAEGHVHDLSALAATERARPALRDLGDLAVGWGRWPTRAPRKSLRLGSCQAGPPPVVRIHPVLDHRDVPAWFVGFVLYHELLHVRFPPLQQGRRRVVHPRSFRMAERQHPHYAEATAWERRHVRALLDRTAARVRGAR